MTTLGGNVVIRNGTSLDFCWREAIKSLLPVCDVVSVCDAESDDGTQDEIRGWMLREPKLVLCVWPWTDPVGHPDWFVEWINYNREHIQADWQFQLDADEVVHEKSYQEIEAMTNQELLKKWQNVVTLGKYIFTWTEPLSLAYLAEKASHATLMAESGTYMGASAFAMMNGSPAGHIWCVDPFMVAGTQMVTEHNLHDFIAAGRCEIIPKRSGPATEQLAHVRGKLDLVFIDDGHAFEDLVYDIEHWLPMVRHGGTLCGHDYETNPRNDVANAVQALLSGHTVPVPRMWEYVVP